MLEELNDEGMVLDDVGGHADPSADVATEDGGMHLEELALDELEEESAPRLIYDDLDSLASPLLVRRLYEKIRDVESVVVCTRRGTRKKSACGFTGGA